MPSVQSQRDAIRLIMRLVFLTCCLVFCLRTGNGSPNKVIRAAVKVIEPLVSTDDKGDPAGFSIGVLKLVSREIGRPVSYIWVDSVEEQIKYVNDGKADLGIAAISITASREKTVDFSHPYFRSGLRIAIKNTGNSTAGKTIRSLLSFDLLGFLLGLIGLTWLSGNLLWYFERHSNSTEFPKNYYRGTGEAAWWSISTLITGACEGKSAKSVGGRLVSLVWMLSGIVLIATFTATLASRMTIDTVLSSITKPEDLSGRIVATVRGTMASTTLHDLRAKVLPSKDVTEAVNHVASGRADAVVFDSPVLTHELEFRDSKDVVIIGPLFDHQDYGIAIADEDKLIEEVDQALLKIVESGELAMLHEKWFGSRE